MLVYLGDWNKLMRYLYKTKHGLCKQIASKLFLFIQLLIAPLFVLTSGAQVQTYKQANNEIDFNHDLGSRWSLELNLGQSWTSKPENGTVFSDLSQLYGRAWAHYMPNNKWKLSFFYAYYHNNYVPEIDQNEAPEWRSAIQATYYIHRQRTVLSTRFRIEDRHIRNADSVFEAVGRLRGQLKMVYPFNSSSITKGTIYAIASEELFFKNKSKVSGDDIFDRNKFTAGFGFGVTRNLQIEITYSNEFLPRTVSNSYNAVQLNIVINNFLPRLSKYLFNNNKRNDAATAD
jgi:hypothetical protein